MFDSINFQKYPILDIDIICELKHALVPTFLNELFCIIFKNRVTSCFSTLMTEKKAAKKIVKAKVTTPKAKAVKSKAKKLKEQIDDMGIVIVDDDITIDQEKVNEERRAYLEESRSQDAYD